MASAGNRQRANCIGTISLHIAWRGVCYGSVRLPCVCHKSTFCDNVCGDDVVVAIKGYLVYYGWLGSRVVSVLDSGAEGPGFKSQSRRCRVTVLGKLFTPIVPLFTKQQNW